MNIIGKEYRDLKSSNSIQENDVQGTLYSEYIYRHLYIYDEQIATRWSSKDRKDEFSDIFGSLDMNLKKQRKNNLNRSIALGNDPISIGNYEVFNKNKIEIIWRFHENTEIIFKGQVLLNGDALIGIFYKNGEINVPERVYYNIDKPLPEPLLKEK